MVSLEPLEESPISKALELALETFGERLSLSLVRNDSVGVGVREHDGVVE
jgi:hypothetical protein